MHNKTESELSSCFEEALLHLHDALRKIGWDFSETFTAAVHNVVVAGAAGRTHCNLRSTRPRLRQRWSCPESTRFTICDGHQAVFNVSTEDLRPDIKAERGKQEKNIENRHKNGRQAGLLLTLGVRVVCNGACKQKWPD